MPSLKRKKSHKRLSNALVFLVAFLLFLLLFGGLCLWAVVKINQERQSTQDPTTSVTEEGPIFSEEDAKTLLLVTTDAGEAQGFVAVRMDPAAGRISTMAFPRETAVYSGTDTYRLYELFASQGVTGVRDSLSQLTDIAFDNYAVITYDNIEKLVTYLGDGLLTELSENLDYNADGYFIKLEAGPRVLTAPQVTNVLRYPNWQGGRRQKAAIQAQLTSSLINQYLTPARQSTADKDFSTIVNLLQSDIRVSHYNAAKAGLDYLGTLNKDSGSICSAASFPGEFVGSGDQLRFYADDQVKAQLGSAWGVSG